MRKKKQRPLFSPHQIQTMENEFAKQRYVTEDKKSSACFRDKPYGKPSQNLVSKSTNKVEKGNKR